MKNCVTISALTGLCVSLSAVAADITADAVVVTASRVPTPIEQVGSSVTVIDAEEIARQKWRSLPEALAAVPGLRVSPSGGPGAQTSVFTRGTNSNHTLILIDGVRAGDPSTPNGAYDFAHLLLDDVERIEIVRGPQSSLYGSDAIGGVINIITRRGRDGLHGYARVDGGSFRTLSEAAGVSSAQNRFHYALNASHTESDGQDVTPARLRAGAPAESDGYRNTTVSANAGFAPTADTMLNLLTRYSEARSQLDVGSGEDPDSESTARQSTVRAEARGTFLNGLWRPLLAVNHTRHQRENFNERQTATGDEDHTRYSGTRDTVEFQNDLYLGTANVMTVGAETAKETMQTSGTSVYGSGFGDFIITQDTDTSERARSVYLLDQLRLGRRWRGNAGIRWDDHDTFDPVVTYRIAPLFLIPETATRLKASYGTGYKAPSLFERFGIAPTNYGFAYTGNPTLQPEESRGWEAGLEQSVWGGRFEGGATYFSNRIENLIQTVYLPSFDSTSVNISQAKTWGGEAFLATQAAGNLRLRLDYTYTRTLDTNGLELLRRPRHGARLNMEYQLGTSSQFSAEMLYTGERQDVDRVTGARITASDYVLVNLAASTDLARNLSVFGRIQNLFNHDHEPVSGFQGPGRGLFVGIRTAI